jgi:hypothetical protein
MALTETLQAVGIGVELKFSCSHFQLLLSVEKEVRKKTGKKKKILTQM